MCGDFVIHPELCFDLLDWSCDPLFSPTLPMGQDMDLLEERHKRRASAPEFAFHTHRRYNNNNNNNNNKNNNNNNNNNRQNNRQVQQ
ncbi:unnamed protein product [Closterium sp. NIES-54]